MPPPAPYVLLPPPPSNVPTGWGSYYSHEHGRFFFVNSLTNRSTWDIPVATAEHDKFIFPIRNRSVRSELEKAKLEEDETRGQIARSKISPHKFEEADPRRYVSGNFFANIGIHFPEYGYVTPSSSSFAYFKRIIKEQGIFCEKMDDAEVLDIATNLFVYDARMNIDSATDTITDQEYRAEHEAIRRMLTTLYYTQSDEDKIILLMDTTSVLLWRMLRCAKEIQKQCEGTSRIDREDPTQKTKHGSMIVSTKWKRCTITTCGFTAPAIAVATLFLQVMGSDFLNAFRKHSKCSVKTKARSRSKTPDGTGKGVHGKITIYNDEILSKRLAAFDKTLSVYEPRLYAKLNTVINQLYDTNAKYKTGIQYMNSKRPDLFVYSGLKPGINIISVIGKSGVTIHHSFIFNMGYVSVIMDSWAHGNHAGYLFGRELLTRIWVTNELEPMLDNLRPDRTRTFPEMKKTLIQVFLAPHMDNITRYPEIAQSSDKEMELYLAELAKNDKTYDSTDYTIISINQNFLMTIFSFNFGFTNDILFGGSNRGKIKSKSLSSLKKRRLHSRSRRRHATHKKMIK